MCGQRQTLPLVARCSCISSTACNRCPRLRRTLRYSITCPSGMTKARKRSESIAYLSPLLTMCGSKWASIGYLILATLAAIPDPRSSSPRPTMLRSSASSLRTLTTRSWLLSLRNRAAVNAIVTIATTSTAATITAGTGVALTSMCRAQRWACSRQPDIPAASSMCPQAMAIAVQTSTLLALA